VLSELTSPIACNKSTTNELIRRELSKIGAIKLWSESRKSMRGKIAVLQSEKNQVAEPSPCPNTWRKDISVPIRVSHILPIYGKRETSLTEVGRCLDCGNPQFLSAYLESPSPGFSKHED
jgi:hypothetical protein